MCAEIQRFFLEATLPEDLPYQPRDDQELVGLGETTIDLVDLLPTAPADPTPEAKLTGEDYERASRDYPRRAYLDLIIDDGAKLKERLRWFPGAKRPSISLRWGTGVTFPGMSRPPQIRRPEDMAKQTGVVGVKLVTEMQRRMHNGDFGDWPQGGESRFAQVCLLGAGTQNELIEAARRQGLDGLILFSITMRPIGTTRNMYAELKVRLIDVNGQLPVWNSTMISSRQIAAASGTVENPADEFVDLILKEIDATWTLAPMPALKPEHVQGRVAKILDTLDPTVRDDCLAALVEVRYYQACDLLGLDEATAVYDKILGAGKGQVLAAGRKVERRELLETWSDRFETEDSLDN